MKRTLLCFLLLACFGLAACTHGAAPQSDWHNDFDDTVLYAEHGLTLTATALSEAGGQAVLLLACKNDNAFPIGLWSSQTAVNGITVASQLETQVAANSEAELSLLLFPSELAQAGITQLDTIDLTLYIDNMDEGTELAYTPTLHLALTDAAVSAPQPPAGAALLTEQKDVRVYGCGIGQDDKGWYAAIYIENGSSQTILVNAGQIAVDGVADTDAYMAEEVLPNTVRHGRIHLSADAVKDAVGFTLTVSDFAQWDVLFQAEDLQLSVS